ncbi:hypothetical protein [Bartonella sp. AA85SXKL]|uniref:hypothetical protein n=1 Tax=Bartonella sp. AA85SXKL TaxID=3243440 RepID=UPI0035D0A820
MRCEEVFGKELLEEDLFWGHWGGVRAVCGGKVFLDAGVIGVVDVPAHHDALAKVLVCAFIRFFRRIEHCYVWKKLWFCFSVLCNQVAVICYVLPKVVI